MEVTRYNKFLLIGLIFANIFCWSFVFELSKPHYLQVCFFDVGQGDSIFINTQQNQQILIDGGPSDAVIKKLASKMPMFDKTIDLVVLTHPHSDHLYGLLPIFDNYKVENFLWTGQNYDTKTFQKLKDLLAQEKSTVYIAKQGLEIKLSDNEYLKVIFPFDSLEGQTIINSQANDNSIVLMLNSFNDRILFTGDASYKIESAIEEKGIDIGADVLKVSHHGSISATSDYFLEQIAPRLAVISVGENNTFNHPAQETLDRLNKYKIKVARTDKNGDICLIQKKIGQFSLSSQTALKED